MALMLVVEVDMTCGEHSAQGMVGDMKEMVLMMVEEDMICWVSSDLEMEVHMMERVGVNMTCLVVIIQEMEVGKRTEVWMEVEHSQKGGMAVLLILVLLLLNVHLCDLCYL